ncbi:MAG: c-type cytochrome [bacterium]|nr:c-type cytochrome [bacterium]
MDSCPCVIERIIKRIDQMPGVRKEGRPLFGNSFCRGLRPIALLAITLAIGFAALPGRVVAEEGDVDLVRGEELFALCTQCHSSDGGGNRKVLAPAIAGLPAWYLEMQLKNFKEGVRGLHAEDTGGLRMYPMSLWLRDEADQKSVAAYVASLPSVELAGELEEHGNAAKGAGYYAVCSACHGPDAAGNQAMGAPPLTGQNDWYLFSSIQKYKHSVRGGGKGDMFGAAMIGMVKTLPDDNAILDVIAHIQSLEK